MLAPLSRLTYTAYLIQVGFGVHFELTFQQLTHMQPLVLQSYFLSSNIVSECINV